VALATTAPILVAPAMNVHMYEHPATQEHLQRLRRRGVRFVGPDRGSLACGYEAMGHLADVEQIVEAAWGMIRARTKRKPRRSSGKR
jgi:phosphopantothenoylcysteine synthetase/decarboxylase